MNQPSGPIVLGAFIYMLVPIVVIGIGFLSVLRPGGMWFLAEGWKFKDAEPSGCALVMTRIGGLFSIVVGIVLALFVYGFVKVN